MNLKAKIALILFIAGFLQGSVSGCTTVKEKAVHFWESITGEQSEKQTKTREEAVKEYKYSGYTDELIVGLPVITPNIVSPGDKVKQELQYTLFAPQREKIFKVTETVILSGGGIRIELATSLNYALGITDKVITATKGGLIV